MDAQQILDILDKQLADKVILRMIIDKLVDLEARLKDLEDKIEGQLE